VIGETEKYNLIYQTLYNFNSSDKDVNKVINLLGVYML